MLLSSENCHIIFNAGFKTVQVLAFFETQILVCLNINTHFVMFVLSIKNMTVFDMNQQVTYNLRNEISTFPIVKANMFLS